MIFDFVEYVRSIRYKRWSIDRVGARIGQVFALQFVFGLVTNKALWRVKGRLNRFRRLWIYRLRDLTSKELWIPFGNKVPSDPDFNRETFTNGLRRCMFCRPIVAHFCAKAGKQVKIRPCWRTHICPFCWANLAIAQYVYTKHAINRLTKNDANLVAVCRVVRQYVPAPRFNFTTGPDPEELSDYVDRLQPVIRKHKARYAKLVATKALQRKTLGSLWRLVVIPDAAGWQVEIRQFFICRAGVKPPLVNTRGCKVLFHESISLNSGRLTLTEDFYNLFGPFCQYPLELLTGYAHLVAAYLKATHNERLITGTGALGKSSRSLIAYMRERAAHARARKEAKKAKRSADRPDPQDPGNPRACCVRL